MADTKVFSFPENNGSNDGLFGGGWGGGVLGFLLGLMFGNGGFGGFGGWGGNRGVGETAYLGNMISNDNGRDLLMQAITNNGEMSRQAVSQLATTLNQDFNQVNSAVQAIQTSLSTVAANQGLNTLQVINAIQSGNSALASQLSQCCCETRLATCQQTNAINQGFAGVQQSIASKSAADQLATCQQTYALTDAMNRNYLALDNKIDAMESQRKDREITKLTADVAKLESERYTAGVVQSAIAPIVGQLNAIGSEVAAIKRCQPATITLPDNSMTAVPTIWANAAADNFLDRVNAALTAAVAPTTTTPATTA
jgi:hypothetical protein